MTAKKGKVPPQFLKNQFQKKSGTNPGPQPFPPQKTAPKKPIPKKGDEGKPLVPVGQRKPGTGDEGLPLRKGGPGTGDEGLPLPKKGKVPPQFLKKKGK